MLNLTFSYLFIVGMVLGSFYNVVGLRVPIQQSIVSPRSSCPHCKHQLTPIELVPVFSYLFLRGKCRSCKARITPIYPLMELLSGILFVTAPLVIGWTTELIVAWTLISLFMIITVSDMIYMIIPDKVLVVFAGIFLFERIFLPLEPWWDSVLGGLLAFIVLLLIAMISRGGMGGGDIKLFALIGFVVGTKTVLLSFFLSSLLGALVGVIGLTFRFYQKKQPIPFGPFIVAGTLAAYYFGDWLVNTYLKLLTTGL
ncbi:A24 family peptidase [Bacillus sp. 03113]|uniref:prepilin peptidase n=1 Tax=Bacillus sp. 03113 TaxID=2578211 RepID=UPI0011422FD2|nr:A24 family peptidase [Bacillus sp. 03113]